MSVSQTFAALICDFDGTLVDTEPLYVRAWERAVHALGIPGGIDFTAFIGASDPVVAHMLSERVGGRKTPREIIAVQRSQFLDIMPREIRLFSGVWETLRALSGRGIPLVIATNSPREYVSIAAGIVGISGFFRGMICGDDVSQPKPHPQVFEKAAALAGVAKDRCAAIEDSIAGVTAAKAAGLFCFALPTSYPRERLARADALLDCFADVLAYFPQETRTG